MLRVFFKKHDFDPDMLIRVMLIKKKACIDQKVRDFLIALRHRGGIVSSTFAIAIGKAFFSESCGESVKNLCIGQSWAQSLFFKCHLQPKSLYLIKPGKKLNLFLCTRLLRK